MNFIKVSALLLCFILNWMWVSFAADMDFNMYNYLELMIFSLVQYFFASVGLYFILMKLYYLKKKDTINLI